MNVSGTVRFAAQFGAKLTMLSCLRFLLLSLLLANGYAMALAQNTTDPIQDLVGDWDIPGSITSISISPRHVVQHSRFGRGDIKWDNADYFLVSYRDRSMICHYIVRVYSPVEASFLRAEPTDPAECDLGDLRRSPGSGLDRPPPPGPSRLEKRSGSNADNTQKGGQSPAKALPSGSGSSPAANAGAAAADTSVAASGSDVAAVSTAEPGTISKVEAPREPPRPPGSTMQDCSDCPEVRVIPAGSFQMGSTENELEREKDEGPLHTVTIKQFALGAFPITKKQFNAFIKDTNYHFKNQCTVRVRDNIEERAGYSYMNPGFYQDDMHPVVCVNWYDAIAYASWLSKKTGKLYRLPSESEREYATRSGTTTPYYFGASISTGLANFDPGVTPISSVDNPGKGTLPVESFEPNAFGLYQMHGNVAEWTQDCWNSSYEKAPSNGAAASTGDCSKRVLRGGAWGYRAFRLRSAYREAVLAVNRYFHVGFRVAREEGPQ